MILKLKNTITNQEVLVTTSSNTPDEVIKIEFNNQFGESLERELRENGYGYYGHILDFDQMTNLDLHSAIMSLPGWLILESRGIPTPSLKEDILRE